jgi:hypothetical protein
MEQRSMKNVYQLIAAVAADIAKQGIAKDRNNAMQGYKFRGIDDVYNALSPIMSAHGLVILPRILGRIITERTTPKGGVLFYVTVEAEFDFVSSHDSTKHTVRTFGEAMDSGDKATNKAMSAAYKYAAFQTFCIPTEGDNDADAVTHVVAPKATPFNLEAANKAIQAAKTLDELQAVWNTQGAIAMGAKDRDGYASLKALVSDRKAVLEGKV